MRRQRLIKIRDRALLIFFIALPIVAIIIARRARTRWPFVTVFLYTLFFVLLVVPFLWGVFVAYGDSGFEPGDIDELPDLYDMLYGQSEAWPMWLIFAGMILAQIFLLIIPVRISHERPKPRRGIWPTAIAAAFMYTMLLFGVIAALLSAISGDDWLDYFGWIFWGVLPLNWVLWLVVFRLFANKSDPKSYLRRVVKWLIHGSILELLIAVPSHIIVRHKDVCCAHMTTAAGIAAGLAVMFFAFGPGLYYLYWERIKSKKPDLSDKQPETPEDIQSRDSDGAVDPPISE